MKNARGVFVSFSNRILGIAILSACLMPAISYAQEPQKTDRKPEQKTAAQDQKAQQGDAVKIKDYSAGFEKFYKLGLPDVSNAKYVKLDLYSFGGDSMFRSQMHSMGITGNAWLIKEDKAGKSLFIMDNCRMIEVYDFETLSKIRAKEIEEKAKQNKGQKQTINRFSYMDDGKTSGKWENADLKRDLTKILEFLNKKKGDDTGNSRNFEYDQLSMEGGYGALLLTAIHAYKKGFKDEANQITGKLFERAKEPQKVIVQGMTVLADGKYNEIMDRFFAGGDWNTLGKDLDGLLSTFSSGWRNAGAIRKLVENVKKRAATAAPPELTDPQLTDEDKKLAAEISVADNSKIKRFEYRRELWILRAEKSARKKAESENITNKITSRGIKSVPLLLVLLKDDYLTRIDLTKIRGYTYISHISDGSAQDRTNEIYQSLRRPASRADFAASLLNPILNQDQYEARKEGPEAMFDACSEWYEENKDKTPIELAKSYMTEENSFRKNEAVSFLIKNGSEDDVKEVEKYLLESDASDYSSIQLAQEYALKRGDKARDFAEKFIKKLDEEKTEDENDEPKNDHMKKQTADAIKNFKEAISSATARDIINEILSEKKTFDESMTQLSRKLSCESRENSEKMLLEAAINAKDPDLSVRFLSLAERTLHTGFVYMEDDAEEAGAEEDGSPKNIELWRKLLSDERKTGLSGFDSTTTVGDSVAFSLDSKYGGISPEKTMAIIMLGTERIMPITKDRALKILEGKKDAELPSYPDSKNISEEKKQKIIEEVKSSSDPQKTLSQLSNDELIAFVEEADKKPEIIGVLSKIADKVKKVESEISGMPEIEEIKGVEGKVLDKGTLEKIFAVCKNMASENKDMRVLISRKPCLEGVFISFIKTDKKKNMMTYLDQKESQAFASAALSAPPNLWTSARWTLRQKEKKEKKKGDLLEEALDEIETDSKSTESAKQDQFWKGVEELCAGKGNVLRSVVIVFSANSAKKEEPEKKPEANSEGTGKTDQSKEEKK